MTEANTLMTLLNDIANKQELELDEIYIRHKNEREEIFNMIYEDLFNEKRPIHDLYVCIINNVQFKINLTLGCIDIIVDYCSIGGIKTDIRNVYYYNRRNKILIDANIDLDEFSRAENYVLNVNKNNKNIIDFNLNNGSISGVMTYETYEKFRINFDKIISELTEVRFTE